MKTLPCGGLNQKVMVPFRCKLVSEHGKGLRGSRDNLKNQMNLWWGGEVTSVLQLLCWRAEEGACVLGGGLVNLAEVFKFEGSPKDQFYQL